MTKGLLIVAILISCVFSGFGAFAGNSIGTYTMSKDTIKEDVRFPAKEYFLKSGKSFTILQTYESDYLVNAYILGKGLEIINQD